MTLDEYLTGADALSPATLAEAIGISESTLSRIRNFKQNTTREVMLRIIAATGGLVTAEGLVNPHVAEANSAADSALPGKTGDVTDLAVADRTAA